MAKINVLNTNGEKVKDITLNKEAGTGVLASTTGNVYGIYDMSGGANENVMGMQKTSNGTIQYQNSGFNANNMVESKYYDLYEYGTNSSDYSRSKLGDATGETRNWYSNAQSFIYSSSGWFRRGGGFNDGTSAGIFIFNNYNGYANGGAGARAVVLLSQNLEKFRRNFAYDRKVMIWGEIWTKYKIKSLFTS